MSFLYGPPASGKLTIGRILADRTGFALFHNHLVVDAVAAVFPFGSDPFVRLRERFWLDMVAAAAQVGRSIIFTFAPEPTVAPDFPARLHRAVEDVGGTVVRVALDVDDADQEARLTGADRAGVRQAAIPRSAARVAASPGDLSRRHASRRIADRHGPILAVRGGRGDRAADRGIGEHRSMIWGRPIPPIGDGERAKRGRRRHRASRAEDHAIATVMRKLIVTANAPLKADRPWAANTRSTITDALRARRWPPQHPRPAASRRSGSTAPSIARP